MRLSRGHHVTRRWSELGFLQTSLQQLIPSSTVKASKDQRGSGGGLLMPLGPSGS
jgi:hypothetical protein